MMRLETPRRPQLTAGGPFGRRRSVTVCLALLACLAAVSTTRPQSSGSPWTPGGALQSATEARLAVRAGDAAPGVARFSGSFACRLASAADRGLLFVDARGTAIFQSADGGAFRTLTYPGQEVPGVGRFATFCETAAGGDGSIAFRASLADGREGIFRIAPGAFFAEPVLLAGSVMTLNGGDATVSILSGPAVTGAGTVVVSVDFLEGVAAILAIPPGGSPLPLIQTGDPLGPGLFQRSPTGPAANGPGVVAFTASLDSDAAVVATVAPTGSPQPLFIGLPTPGGFPPAVDLAAPAINDAGQVAFLWTADGAARLQRVSSGLSQTLAAPGQPVPGGTVVEVTDLEPVINPAGGIYFGAVLSTGAAGIYLAGAQPILPVAEPGVAVEGGGALTGVATRQPAPRPALAVDGSLRFAGESIDAAGAARSGLFAATPPGTSSGASSAVSAVVLSGDAISGQARFASFLEMGIPHLAGGPFLGPGGTMIFDARLTGGGRGLFLRDRAGLLSTVALDGDAAPGGGGFDGEQFAFHSVNGQTVAFLGGASIDPLPSGDGESSIGTGGGSGRAVYYGRPAAGLQRVLGVGDPEPGGSRTIADLQPPSRVNRSGEMAVPAVLSDGDFALYGFDGSTLFRVVGTGDPAPGGARFVRVFTGSIFLNAALPPLLDDEGTVLFGAMTSDGDVALFTTPLRPAGASSAQRILGAGDAVEGGRLFPFEIQAVDRDALGRLALVAVFDDNFDFGTFLKEGTTQPAAVARPFDLLADLGFVYAVSPHLALTGGGGLAYGVRLFDGREALLLRAPAGTAPAGATGGVTVGDSGAADTVVAATGRSAPDGGVYLALQRGIRATNRIGSDGGGLLAFAAATDAGPEEIVLSGTVSNAPPVADAGPDQTVECADPSGTIVQLDGRASSDPDGDPLTYHWSGTFGEADGAQPLVRLPPGVSTITLTVSDGAATSAPDVVTIMVRDTLPPFLNVSAIPAILWPPDGRMVNVSFRVTVADRCDPQPAVVLADVQVEDSGPGRQGGSVAGADLGTDDRSILLRAKRTGGGAGRIYKVVYRATDRSGNGALATALVTVPHDQRLLGRRR